MTKAMMLRVTFDGYYGGSVDEVVLLPMNINGVLFESLEERTYDEAIYLGEIAGKHSECYGDLQVDIVDLDKLTVKAISDLIDVSDFGEFESFFEGIESDYEDSGEDEGYDESKINELLKSYEIEPSMYGIRTSDVYDKFIESLKEQYVKKFLSVTVLENDYEAVLDLLMRNKIQSF